MNKIPCEYSKKSPHLLPAGFSGVPARSFWKTKRSRKRILAKRNKYAILSAVHTADSFLRKGFYDLAYCGADRCGGRHRADGDGFRRGRRFDAGAAAFVWCGYGVRPIDVHLYCADGFACVEFRRKTNFRFVALPIAIFSLSGIVMINLIKSLDLRLIGAAFGAFLLALSLYYLLFAGRASLRPTRGVVLACSAVSGVFSGLFSIGGPMMALCLLPCAEDHEQYVGNMQTLFVVTNRINIAARVANGLYTVELIPISLVGIVFILLGRAIGTRLVRQLSAEVIKRAVYLFVGISGAMTLIENIL